MPFVPKKQAFNAHINEVVLGVGDKATAIGGQNVLPFHTFDAEIKNAPKIGVELTDFGMEEYTMPGEKEFYAGCETVVDMAKRAETMEGASFASACTSKVPTPTAPTSPSEECVALAKAVADAVTMPIVIMGCKNIEKDTELFNKIAEALAGQEHSRPVRPRRKLQDGRRVRRSGLRPEGRRGIRRRYQPCQAAEHRHDPARRQRPVHRHEHRFRRCRLRL